MGQTHLYRDSLGGLHETQQKAYTNPMGQTVDYSPRGFYTSTGTQYTATPYSANGRTGSLTLSGAGTGTTSGLSSILGGGTGATAGTGGINLSANSAKTQAQNAYQGAIDTANTALGSAQDAAGKSEAHITNASSDLGAARTAANGIGTSITNINAAAAGLAPYAKTIAGQGGSLLDLYSALIGGDPSVGGIAGDYLGATRDAADALLQINPETYAARAASDQQASFQNAQAQAQRELARRGVSAGSGATTALQDQFARVLATARAAARTSYWQKGLEDQTNALTKRAALFKDVLSAAQSAGQQGTQDFATAAGIIQKQGDMFSAAGSLGATQTNAFANIGGVEVNLGQLDLSNEKLVQDAYANVQASQQALAKFYQETMPVEETKDAYGVDNDVTTIKKYL